MLETITGAAATANTPPTAETATPKQEQSSFLMTPRSMMPSWCESPRVQPDSAQQDVVLDDKKLSIEIPHLGEPREAAREQRDASEGATNEAREEDGAERMSEEAQAPVDSSSQHAVNPKYECDYDKNPTKIFLSLQKKEWDATIKRADEDTLEARTWVSRREKHGNLRWRLLPLHAAIIFKAPENVVESLLAAYPKGAQSKDDQGMLPLHLAFRHGSTEATVNLLLVAFPQSVSVEDRKGRIPLVLAQAAASANRESFVRALERGPTYYANAAAATERAAVTAEQRALFDSKLIEVEKKHQQDMSALKEERDDLTETITLLQTELAKQKGSTQVLVDHINSLEAHLRNKGETEKFLAVKAATLDTTLKEMGEAKETTEHEMEAEIIELKNENARLLKEMEEMNKVEEGQLSPEQLKKMTDKLSKQDNDLKSLKMEWASTQARAAVLEAQLKNKIENEHELASQVSQLAGKLANSAADSSNQVNMYSRRVETLEAEREKLRATVNDLGKKLLKVSQFMNKMTAKTQETNKQMSEEAKLKQAKQQAKLQEDASNHEQLIRTALAERQHMAELLKKQEEEMERSAKQHQEILDQLAALKEKSSAPEDESAGDEIPLTNSLNDEMREMMDSVLSGMPQGSSGDSDDLVDAVMKNVIVPTPKASGSAQRKSFHSEPAESSLRSDSTDTEEDAQQCLEEALKALELNRTKSANEGSHLKSASDGSDTLSCNPSDEESLIK